MVWVFQRFPVDLSARVVVALIEVVLFVQRRDLMFSEARDPERFRWNDTHLDVAIPDLTPEIVNELDLKVCDSVRIERLHVEASVRISIERGLAVAFVVVLSAGIVPANVNAGDRVNCEIGQIWNVPVGWCRVEQLGDDRFDRLYGLVRECRRLEFVTEIGQRFQCVFLETEINVLLVADMAGSSVVREWDRTISIPEVTPDLVV
ncbi:hypothetical protein [Natrinema amylolyticum]|uniref:hypothetical protein n=1 Tax=Natrinema amylolyticum TaxID=2878679 RepID=UPI001CFC05FC|nr:hypothetical protein [Natrinema amylolyticum]